MRHIFCVLELIRLREFVRLLASFREYLKSFDQLGKELSDSNQPSISIPVLHESYIQSFSVIDYSDLQEIYLNQEIEDPD